MTLSNVHIVARSGNSKTGTMPVTYRPMSTCPSTCAFLPKARGGNGGCFGQGRIFGIADKYASRIVSHDDAVAKLNGAEKSSKYLRDRVVGDVVTPDGTFDIDYVESIAAAARTAGLVPFGYTHAWTLMSKDDVARVNASGYAMNASCETEQDLADATTKGLPTTVVGDQWAEGEIVAGRRVITCPAQTRDDVTCSSCGLCAKPNRPVTIRFLPHGSGAKQAQMNVNAKGA